MKILKIALLLASVAAVWLAVWQLYRVINASRPAAHGGRVRLAARALPKPGGDTKEPARTARDLSIRLSQLFGAGATPDPTPRPAPSTPVVGTPQPAATPTPAEQTEKSADGTGDTAAAESDEALDDEGNGPGPVSITTTGLPSARIGTEYYAPLFAAGGTLPYSWRLNSGSLPSGLSLNTHDAFIAGTPLSTGNHTFSLSVTDAEGGRAETVYSLSVLESDGFSIPRPAGVRTEPLYLTTGPLPEAPRGEPYSVQMEATGGKPPYAWSISDGKAPAGIALGPATGLLSGNAREIEKAVFRITVTDNGLGSDVAEYIVNVRGDDLVIVTAALETGTAGEYYYDLLEASGGLSPYRWSVSAGALHDGLELDGENGAISGSPLESGDNALTLTVTDAQGGTSSASLTLTVYSPTITVVTKSLPEAAVGEKYDTMLEADGGVEPYRWFLAGAAPPDGLSLDSSTGDISGVPTAAAETATFVVAVTDVEGSRAERTLTLEIGEPSTLSVDSLSATPSDGKTGLTWRNPDNGSFSRTDIVRNTVSPPSNIDDGLIVYSGNGESFLDSGLANGTTYYYSAFAIDAEGKAGSGEDGARAAATPKEVSLSGNADPFADAVSSYQPLSAGGFGSSQLPSIVLGAPHGGGTASGSLDVLSLHARANDDAGASAPYGGSVTLEFSDNLIVDGDGSDFIVFENVFYIGGDPENRWMEPAIVAVSRDGIQFFTFPYDFVPHYKNGEINLQNPYCYSRGFTGVNPVFSNGGSPDPRDPAAAGGDPFDLSDVGLDWARYVRITATGDNWLTARNGYTVRHITEMGSCSGSGASGFDLDAVGAINY